MDGGGEEGGFPVGDKLGARAALATEDLRLAALCFAARYSFRCVSATCRGGGRATGSKHARVKWLSKEPEI